MIYAHNDITDDFYLCRQYKMYEITVNIYRIVLSYIRNSTEWWKRKGI